LLINFLRHKTALLILDNCEHLLDASAHVADTLLKHLSLEMDKPAQCVR